MDRPERDQKVRFKAFSRLVILFAAPFVFSSCAGVPLQDRIRAQADAGRYAEASKLLSEKPNGFGKKNKLLYLFEKGYLLHLEGKYRESIDVFEQAKRRYEELYTRSLTNFAASLVLTEYAQDYRGEDFERILINIFQALNYAMLGEFDEALVEARDADVKLGAINSRYPAKNKNVYREDAFCRLLMGLLYENSSLKEDEDNACISFKKALETYEKDYTAHYGTTAPSFLKEKICSSCVEKPFACAGRPLFNKKRAGEVFVIHYQGFSPLKEEVSVPVPLPEGYISSIAFPKYNRRPSMIASSQFRARQENGREYVSGSECVQDIASIAEKNLNDRKGRVLIKAAAVAAGKYALEEKQEDNISRSHGNTTAALFRLLASIYNLASNRADLRSWQTLPEKIMVSRIVLDPGTYSFDFSVRDISNRVISDTSLGACEVRAGEKKFFIVASPY